MWIAQKPCVSQPIWVSAGHWPCAIFLLLWTLGPGDLRFVTPKTEVLWFSFLSAYLNRRIARLNGFSLNDNNLCQSLIFVGSP